MRGEQHDTKEPIVPIIKTKKISPIALITDEEGNTVFLVRPTWWSKLVISLFIILLTIAALLALITYYNFSRINQIEDRINDKDIKKVLE